VTVSWIDRCIAYSMLLEGAFAQETARLFRVNTGAVVEWARLAGMVIRMGPRGGIEPVNSSTSAPKPQRANRRSARADRVFIEMAINSMPAWSIRAIGRHLGVAASTVSRELGRHRVETGRGRGASREARHHAGVAHHNTMRSRVRTRARAFDAGRVRGHREHASRTGCVTRTCHLTVQQTRTPLRGGSSFRSTRSVASRGSRIMPPRRSPTWSALETRPPSS